MHKSLGDLAAGTELYERYSAVPPEMTEMRKIIMARKEPRKLLVQVRAYFLRPTAHHHRAPCCFLLKTALLLVQPHLSASSSGAVSLASFAPTTVGMVESFKVRVTCSAHSNEHGAVHGPHRVCSCVPLHSTVAAPHAVTPANCLPIAASAQLHLAGTLPRRGPRVDDARRWRCAVRDRLSRIVAAGRK